MLTDFDKDIIGGNKRITIPMGDRFVLRQVADLLRSLANTMDHWSRLPVTEDMTERLMMMSVSSDIDRVNRLIRHVAEEAGIKIKEGRPPNSETPLLLSTSRHDAPAGDTMP